MISRQQLIEQIKLKRSFLCVGLDTDINKIPEFLKEYPDPIFEFNKRIIDATKDLCISYKPNAAFYEDGAGWRALTETVAYAHGKGVPVVLDAKRADIGNTTRQYAKLLEGDHAADAITVNPYMGRDSLEPFLARSEKGVFVLCRTSNAGGADLQDLELASGEAVYERVAALADLWNANGNIGLVVGATAADELESLREQVPDLPFLVPGVGPQGGDVEAAVEFGQSEGVGLVNSSRGIIFAGDGENFDRAAGEAAKRLKKQLNRYR